MQLFFSLFFIFLFLFSSVSTLSRRSTPAASDPLALPNSSNNIHTWLFSHGPRAAGLRPARCCCRCGSGQRGYFVPERMCVCLTCSSGAARGSELSRDEAEKWTNWMDLHRRSFQSQLFLFSLLVDPFSRVGRDWFVSLTSA